MKRSKAKLPKKKVVRKSTVSRTLAPDTSEPSYAENSNPTTTTIVAVSVSEDEVTPHVDIQQSCYGIHEDNDFTRGHQAGMEDGKVVGHGTGYKLGFDKAVSQLRVGEIVSLIAALFIGFVVRGWM